MPIRDSQKALYPANWPDIRAAILERSGGQCECVHECGLHPDHRCIEMNHTPALFAKGSIVLTIAHLNNDPTDNRPENLKAMCQRCHNRYDQPYRQFNARQTRLQKHHNPDQVALGSVFYVRFGFVDPDGRHHFGNKGGENLDPVIERKE